MGGKDKTAMAMNNSKVVVDYNNKPRFSVFDMLSFICAPSGFYNT